MTPVFELSHFYDYCKRNSISVIPFNGMPAEGATMRIRAKYGIFLDFSQIKSTRLLKGVCCHELGHAATGALHKVDSPYETVERSEYRANRWAAQQYLTEEDFREAFSAGYTELWQLAEYFDLPEEVIKKALTYWTESRGVDFNKKIPAPHEEALMDEDIQFAVFDGGKEIAPPMYEEVKNFAAYVKTIKK